MTGSLTSLFAFFTSLFLVIWSERQCLSYTCQAKINRLCMSKIVPKQTKNNKLSKPKFELLRLKKGWIEFFLCLPFAKYRRRVCWLCSFLFAIDTKTAAPVLILKNVRPFSAAPRLNPNLSACRVEGWWMLRLILLLYRFRNFSSCQPVYKEV